MGSLEQSTLEWKLLKSYSHQKNTFNSLPIGFKVYLL